MSPRLTRLVTRTGDNGTTGLGDGTRVAKDSTRIEAIGSVDELNSTLGMLLALPLPRVPPTRELLLTLQQRLFDLGGELAIPGTTLVQEAQVAALEAQIQSLNEKLPPLKEFVLPGGSPAAAACHFARTVCRRAERRCWTLAHAAETTPATPAVNAVSLRFLNRLSDLLFVLARFYARARGGREALWQHTRTPRSATRVAGKRPRKR